MHFSSIVCGTCKTGTAQVINSEGKIGSMRLCQNLYVTFCFHFSLSKIKEIALAGDSVGSHASRHLKSEDMFRMLSMAMLVGLKRDLHMPKAEQINDIIDHFPLGLAHHKDGGPQPGTVCQIFAHSQVFVQYIVLQNSPG